ncbi:MAG: hypothetical protein WA738_12710 [Candidatus Angelobacter sp.]
MNEEREPPNVVHFFGQLLVLPIATFVYGLDMLIKTMQQMQRVTSQSMHVVRGPGPLISPPDSENNIAENHLTSDGIDTGRNENENKEGKFLSYDYSENGLDRNLRDDMLKLVRYKILFVKREYEYAFPEREDLVYDNLDGNAFTAWKVAEFVQELARVKDETTAEGRARVGIRVPHKWKNYPRPEDKDIYTFDGYLTGFPSEDKKYLRVFYQVLERYPREKFRHDERQIEVLEEIRDRIQK